MNQKGFTLVEVLISIAILAFVVLGVNSISSNSERTQNRVLSEDKQFIKVEDALRQLEWDLSQIYSPLAFAERPKKDKTQKSPYDDEERSYLSDSKQFAFYTDMGHPVPIYRQESQSDFEFLASSYRSKMKNQNKSTYSWIRYYTEDDPDKEGSSLVLYRSSNENEVYSKENSLREAKAFKVLENVKDLKFSFWSPREKKFVDRIKDIPDGQHLIEAVKVDLIWIDQFEQERNVSQVIRSIWPKYVAEKDDKKPRRVQ